MKTTRTIELTVERSEVFVRRQARAPVFDWCEICGRRVRMITADEAARFAGVSMRVIYQKVESGELHVVEEPERSLLVCLDSIV